MPRPNQEPSWNSKPRPSEDAEDRRKKRMVDAALAGVPIETIALRFSTYDEYVSRVLKAAGVQAQAKKVRGWA